VTRAAPTVLVLLVVLGAIFGGVIVSGKTLLDGRDLYRCHPWSEVRAEVGAQAARNVDSDQVFQFLPLRTWEAREMREGRFPLWCDDVLGGVPVYADANAGAFNPTRLLLLWLSPLRAWEVGVALRLVLAILLMRMFLRGRGLGPTPALLGGVLYTLGILPAFWLRHDHYLWVHALVPLVAHFAERYGETGRTRFAAYAATAAAAAILGGALQYAVVLAAVGGLWLFVRRHFRALGAMVVYGVVVAGLSAPVLLPAAEWMARAARDTAADRVFWYPPWHLPTLLFPMLVEDPVSFPWRMFLPRSAQTIFGLVPQARAPFAEATLSVGALGFLFVVVAWRRCRGTWAGAFKVAGVLLLLVTMLGPLLPFVAPGFTMTGLGRLNLLTTFALAALAAKGLHDLLTMSVPEHEGLRAAARRFGWKSLVAVGILATMGFVVWAGREPLRALVEPHLEAELPPVREIVSHLTGTAVMLPLAALLIGLLLIFGRAWRRMPALPYRALLVGVAVVEVLVPAVRMNRTWPTAWAFPEAVEKHLPPEGVRALPVGEDVLPGNTNLVHGRVSAIGYLSAWPRTYRDALYPTGEGLPRYARILREGDTDPEALLVDGVFGRDGWTPRAREVEPGVRASNLHPGWRATVNGEEREIVPHRGWAMRVEPPPAPGETVDWRFTAPRLRLGLAIGAGTGIFLCLLLLLGRLGRRRP
jgi:hypothetical protein